MNRKLYEELRWIAYRKELTRYAEIAPYLGIQRIQGDADVRTIALALELVSEHEHKNGRPLLSVVVVNETGQPGLGFFTMAKRLCRMLGDNERAFFESERDAVYEAWANMA